MYNIHKEMYQFFVTHVNLNKDQRADLASYRDTNIERLEAGLEKLDYPLPQRICNQGSYATFTVNQHHRKEYDIDIALIFSEVDVPSNPLKTRKRIESAMIEGGGNFSQPPEARTNAMTVWYAEGHHVDLAIHRIIEDEIFGETLEHAGVEWTERDPIAITEWFNSFTKKNSPSKETGATVADGQFRRVVQLIKMFAKSRSSWVLPGGLVISVLASECYHPDPNQDDVALYETMKSVCHRLASSVDVYNPVDQSSKLNYKKEYTNQIIRLREKLEKGLEWLESLFALDCTQLTAVQAWGDFFKHSYWDDLAEEISENEKSTNSDNSKERYASVTPIRGEEPAKPWCDV